MNPRPPSPNLVAPDEIPHPSSTRGAAGFVTTHWTVVLSAGQRDTPQARAALAALSA